MNFRILTTCKLFQRIGPNLIVVVLLIYSCSSENEPIFHLFESSTSYQDYDEIKHLENEGFDIRIFGDTSYLTKSNGDVELRFMLDSDKTEILKKVARVYVEELDTVLAESVIQQFNARKYNRWEKINGETYTVSVQYKNDKQAVFLIMEGGKPCVETRSDFFHRTTH